MHPLWPVSIATKSVSASFPLTSPSISLSGLILSEFFSRSSIVTSAWPDMPNLASIWTQLSLFPKCNSSVSSIVIILSEYLTKFPSAFSVVVFPELEPPVIIMFIGSMP